MAAKKKGNAASRKPRDSFNEIGQVGLKAHALAGAHAADLAKRLDPTLLTTLASDLTALGAAVPQAAAVGAEAKQATVAQNSALATGYDYVTAAREAVVLRRASKETRKGYGVGAKTDRKVVKSVVAALQVLADRVTAEPAEATALGFNAADATTWQQQVAAIHAADAAQEALRAASPLTTKQRNTVADAIVAAVQTIAAAGIVQFVTDPATRADFAALVGKKA